MSDQNNNQKTKMGNCLPVSRDPGHDGRDEALELQQTLLEAMNTPLTQYQTDDTMPVKAWVSEKKRGSKYHFKPLRPEDERKALEVLNRHLPPLDQIEISQPSLTIPETAPRSRLRLFPEPHLPLPPRCWNRRERLQAAKPYGSSNTTTPAKPLGKKPVRRVRSRNWIQTEDKEEEDARMEELEDDLPVFVVPDLMVTRPDGETRQLRDPNEYVGSK